VTQRLQRVTFWLILAAALTPLHFALTPYDYKIGGVIAHFRILAGTHMTPWSQRVLLPYALDVFASDAWSVIYGMAFLSVVTMVAALMATFTWMRANGISARRAFIGVGVVLYLLPAWYMSNNGIAYNQLEIVFIVAALFAARRGRHGVIAALIVLGTFNRETTGLYIVAACALATRNGKLTLAWGALFVGAYLLVRTLFPGAGSWQYGIGQWLDQIKPEQFPTVLMYHALFVPLWIGTAVRVKHLPSGIKRITWLLPLNLVLFFTFSMWVEVRLLMPAVLLVALPALVAPTRRH